MINKIRESKVSKVIASYLAIQLVVQLAQPAQLWALTSGPSQPEFNSFTPIGTSDMVNVSNGDFNYNIPIMDVGGYPLNLSYNSGITMDQEASWVGLGWNLNVGQIARDVRGLPDDFDGDEVRYENDMKTNVTIGIGVQGSAGFFGKESPLKGNVGITAQHNNYEGITFRPSVGLTYELTEQISAGANLSASVSEGAVISPFLSVSQKEESAKEGEVYLSGTVGININSRKGMESMNFGVTATKAKLGTEESDAKKNDPANDKHMGSPTGVLSFNNTTFTPTKRAAIEHNNFMFTGAFAGTVFGFDGMIQVNGFGASQDIKKEDQNKLVPAFGYENTHKGEGLNGVLDFNREKARTFNKHTTILPVTNYTHDIYSIKGQGISGMFRPYRSQVSYVNDTQVKDEGDGGNLGLKFGFGWNVFFGGGATVSPSTVRTGNWNTYNYALNKFVEKESDNNPLDYEPAYFKMVGEHRVDAEEELFEKQLSGTAPMKLKIGGNKFDRKLLPQYVVKENNNGITSYTNKNITIPNFKRTGRDQRNSSIIKVTQKEAKFDALVHNRGNADFAHHTAGIKILKSDGSNYVYGETAYNYKKVEATFDVSKNTDINCANGLVGFKTVVDNFTGKTVLRGNNSSFSDRYLNRITTPAYAHSYLLSSVLSSDYEDITNDGPTPDDLGAYTRFYYDNVVEDYKWRIPYDVDKVSYNEGLKSNEHDEKGNYLYGEKELKYISKIETKTHVAIFHLSDRKDGRGALGEIEPESGVSAGYMKKIDKISLYSKPEYDASGEAASPIKEAHFVYDYSQCQGVPNNLGGFLDENELPYLDDSNVERNSGKLTLKKVFFTYRDSHMGRYTPYIFNYNGFNPDYNLKSYDIWGNYKPVVKEMLSYDANGKVLFNPPNDDGIETPKINDSFNIDDAYCAVYDPLTAPEFPFVQQEDKKLQDAFASAWTMTSIELPSGGKLNMKYETDEYQYVQKEKAMQMFMVTGSSNTPPTTLESSADFAIINNPFLYDDDNPKDHHEYIHVKLSDQKLNLSVDEFKNKFLGDQIGEPIHFRFLLQMVKGERWQYDYVSGYFEIDQDLEIVILENETKGTYASIPLKKLTRDGGGSGANKKVNPVTKAGWYFGRTYLNRQVNSSDGSGTSSKPLEIINDLLGALAELFVTFNGPNAKLQRKRSSMRFNPNKSWVRLLHPNETKFGGGLRVQQISMQDNWDTMLGKDDAYYAQSYGQQYEYNNKEEKTEENEDETSDGYGVATFEPNGSKENPLVKPFYDNQPEKKRDILASPMESNYVEEPFGESFFPLPTVNYSRVETKNLPRTRIDKNGDTLIVKSSATGKVVNEMFTARSHPTIVDYTEINKDGFDPTKPLQNALGLGIFVLDRNHLTLSQGFSIVTNDMNGRMKSQKVYAEGQEEPISEVTYKYSEDKPGILNNKLPVIDAEGKVHTDKSLATHYDVINEFRESDSNLTTTGVNNNLTGFIAIFYPQMVPMPLPTYSNHEQILRTATTTKVIHKSAILVEKIAKDVNAEVSTQNLAWDAVTGDVILTKTVNEYGNHYYNLNYPAHWYYKGMGLASKNVGISGKLKRSGQDAPEFTLDDRENNNLIAEGKSLKDYFYNGDELMTTDSLGVTEKLWVIDVAEEHVQLMNKDGFVINQKCSNKQKSSLEFKIVRSGYRNQQTASMASITTMTNPIDINGDGTLDDFVTTNFNFNEGSANDPRIVNASAVSYSDYWQPQKELDLPGFSDGLRSLYDQINNEAVGTDGNPLTDRAYITGHKYGFNPYLYNVRGAYRAIKSYAYLGGRNSNVEEDNTFNTGQEGFFTNFNSFYDNGTDGQWTKNKDNWTFASQVETYSPYGAELENKDALDRYSAAQYGYEYTLPVAVGSNSKYQEMGYDGFEDYKDSDIISTSLGTGIRSNHFDFKGVLGGIRFNPIERTNTTAHTGRYSLAVPGGAGEVTQMISLQECRNLVRAIRCPDEGGDNGGSETELGSNCFTRKKRVFLVGSANEIIDYTYDFNVSGLESNECIISRYLDVNGRRITDRGGSGTVRLDQDGKAEFIISGGATGDFGFGADDNVEWVVSFASSSTGGPVTVVLGDLCDDRLCNNGLPGDPVGNNG